jgi:signal transduction histidine kinase/CheY-like chemotaxis protein
VRRDGSRFSAEVVYTAMRDPDGHLAGISQLTRDISERVRLRKLRERSADLEIANREVVQAVLRNADLLRAVASAVEGPLGAVERAAERAQEAKGGDPRALDELLRGVGELRRAVQGLDELAASPAGADAAEGTPLDLVRVATETRDMLRDAAAQRRVRVEVDVDPSLSDVSVDGSRLRQVIYNLLSNAIKFSRERGRVSVRLLPEGNASFRLEVEDSGIGMSAAEIARAFQPRGESEEPGSPGTGLGLLASKQVVEQQGGRLGVQSTPGRGTLVFAVLPRAPGEGAARGDAATVLPAAMRERRVLVVSEDASTRASLSWTLGNAGCEVVAAVGPEEGLDVARERRFEVVAVDLLLETIGAADFVATLRAEGTSRDAPWIVAALGTREAGAAGLLAADLLPRPVPADRLFAALERARVPRGRQSSILVVDGELPLVKAAARTLDILNYRALPEPDGHAALRACTEEPPAAVILSPFLLGLDVFSFLHHLRQVPGLRDVPVLLTVPRGFGEEHAALLLDGAAAAAREGAWHRGFAPTPRGAPDAGDARRGGR